MTATRKMGVGIIGCGSISGIYLKNLAQFRSTSVVALADLDVDRARAKSREFGISRALTVDDLLVDAAVEMVLNLTVPSAHAPVCRQALEAGKHVYVEKPLSVNRNEGMRLLNLAAERNLRIGAATDTFLGGGLQTCRTLIDEGVIGEPVAASAFMLCHGHEHWHPDPAFYYQAGGGPMFDMGPYYLTALVSLLGPVRRVTGSARITFPERTITSKPKLGDKIAVEVPTHIAGVLDFVNGAVATLVTSFDVWFANTPRIEIYGTEGSLVVPDPNTFGGPVLLKTRGETGWAEAPLKHGFTENWRGLGVTDMAEAIQSARPHRASGEMAFHVLDVMEGFHDASSEGRHYEVMSSCERPAALLRDDENSLIQQS